MKKAELARLPAIFSYIWRGRGFKRYIDWENRGLVIYNRAVVYYKVNGIDRQDQESDGCQSKT